MFVLGAIALIGLGALAMSLVTRFWNDIKDWLNNTAADVVQRYIGYDARRAMQKAVNKGGKGAPFGAPPVGNNDQRDHAADGQPPAERPQAADLQLGQHCADGDHQSAFHQPSCVLVFHTMYLHKKRIVPDGRSDAGKEQQSRRAAPP